MNDDKNPKYLFNGVDNDLLIGIVNKKIDPVILAAEEMSKRGLNIRTGSWIGFEKAEKQLKHFIKNHLLIQSLRKGK